MNIQYVASKQETQMLDTMELRDRFLLEDLFRPGELVLTYCDIDRVIVGSACPEATPLALEAADELRCNYFCERRELGVMNLGKPGVVTVDGAAYALEAKECLYIGRGSKAVQFASGAEGGSQFYLISYPAHAAYPTTKASLADANQLHLGSPATSNERIIYQFIHEKGIKSCQLVMGFTQLMTGSVWNTMPPHTHTRRSEVYLYFDIAPDQMVFHFMGDPQETRHLCVQEKQAVLSPAWSIHAGCGTGAYTFVWAMGGENQRFDDMAPAPLSDLL